MLKNILAFSCLIFSMGSNAATYTYTGLNFTVSTANSFSAPFFPYTTSDHLSMTLTVDTPLVANLGTVLKSGLLGTPDNYPNFHLTMSAGDATLDSLSGNNVFGHVTTDVNANIVGWTFRIRGNGPPGTVPIFMGSDHICYSSVTPITHGCDSTSGFDSIEGEAFGLSPRAYVSYPPSTGLWTSSVSPLPIPAAAWLLGSALLGLVAAKRHKA